LRKSRRLKLTISNLSMRASYFTFRAAALIAARMRL